MVDKIKIYHLMKLRYSKFTTKIHMHDHYQLIYIIKGNGEMKIKENSYQCREKDVILIQKNIPHSIFSDDMVTFEAKFLLYDYSINRIIESAPLLTKDSGDIIKNLMDSIDSEIKDNRLFRDQYIKIEFTKLLLSYIRYFDRSDNKEYINKTQMPGIKQNNIFDDIIEYINKNFHKKITIRELAQAAHMEYKYFSKMFNEHYGIGPKRYINYIRIEKVKELLINTSMNISKIAEETGFERIHYLDSIFYQYEGMTPREFRESVTKMYKLNMEYEPAELTNPMFDMK